MRVIDAFVLHQIRDGSAGTTTVELYRRRAGINTLLATVSLPNGGGDFASAIAVPVGALADLTPLDRLYVQFTEVQTGGFDVTAEVQLVLP